MPLYVVCSSMLIAALLLSGTSGLQFNDDTYIASVWETPAENSEVAALGSNPPTPATGVIATAICVGDDGTPVNTDDLRYSIVEGDTSLFSIDELTGEFSVVDHPFDYEEQPWYLVKLLCTLNSDPDKNGTGAVNVTIGHLNEYLPEFDSGNNDLTITIKETTPVGTRVASVDASIGPLLVYPTATDRDSGPDGRIQYILTNSDNRIRQFLELDTASGTLKLKAKLDVDDLPNHFERLEIEITACNENVTISTCPIIGLTIFVTAANEHHPVFSKPLYTASVPESQKNGTSIVEVQCDDEDNGVGSVLSISFETNSSSLASTVFDLTSSGVLSLNSALDYENTTKYDITLVCFDGDNTATTQVIVNVLPVNDNVPQFTEDNIEFSAERTDPSPSDTIIGRVEATDADTGGVGATVTYSINSSSHFAIDQDTGEITLKGYLYSSDGYIFDFDVVASDGEYEARTHVRVTTTGLLSVPEWIYVGVAGIAVLVVLLIVGIIVFYCFIKAARVRIHIKEKETHSNSDSEIDMGSSFPHPPMFPIHPAMFPPDAGMSMVGQPLYPGMEDEEYSEHSSTLATPEGSHYPLTPGPVLKEVVDYFHEGDKLLDKKGNKK